MENKAGNDNYTVACRNILRYERAAVEIYELAAHLLDSDLGEPDYQKLLEAHRSQLDVIGSFLTERDQQIEAAEWGWDRPRSAVLSAATIYGAESPVRQLLDQEQEILAYYETVLESRATCEELRQRVAEELLPRAKGILATLQPDTGAKEVAFAERASA